jgi:hypothetical protein
VLGVVIIELVKFNNFSFGWSFHEYGFLNRFLDRLIGWKVLQFILFFKFAIFPNNLFSILLVAILSKLEDSLFLKLFK